MPKKQYTIKIEEEIFNRVAERASVENRSKNNMFETLLERGLSIEVIDLSRVNTTYQIKMGKH